MKSQGTQLYFIDPADDSVVEVGCPTSIDGIDSTVEQIETTCLGDDARSYEAGLATPGAARFSINADPGNESHVRLQQLKNAGTTIKWALGWSDGTADPTSDTDGEFVLPTSRSWLSWDGFMNGFSFAFGLNAAVQSNVGIQISGDPVLTAKV